MVLKRNLWARREEGFCETGMLEEGKGHDS